MKFFGSVFLCGIVLMFNACERQHPSVLVSIEPAKELPAAAEMNLSKAPESAREPESSSSPKYFPEKK